jgi:voltage-gated potassium channel Kch
MTIQPKISEKSGIKVISEKVRLRLVAVSFVTALTLGTIGYYHYHVGEESVSFSNALYHAAQLFVLHAPHFGEPVPWTLEIARWLAAISTIFLLIDFAIRFFYREKTGLKLNRLEDHSIVCGLGSKGMAVVEKLYQTDKKIVAVEKFPDAEIEERLHRMGIPLVTGDATKKEILFEARIKSSKSVYALCPDDNTNCAIAMIATNISKHEGFSGKCYVHINDTELRSALQTHERKNDLDAIQPLSFIDAFAPPALSLLVNGFPLDHNGISPNDRTGVHLIILGFGRMGRTLAVKAAQLGQFANGKSLQISVIDNQINAAESSLLFYHPYIGDVADILLYQQNILSPETRNLLETWCNEPDKIVNIAVCADNQEIAFSTVFNLLPVFNRKNVKVAVRVADSESFNFLIDRAKSDKYSELRIIPFGMEKGYENLTNPDKNETEKFAIDIHKAYVSLVHDQLKNDPGELGKRKQSGELNQWNNLKEDFRESSRQQAMHMYIKTRAAGYEIVEFADERPAIEKFEGQDTKTGMFEKLAIMEHNRWIAERRVNNWKYGVNSDKPNRINPYLVDWSKLPEDVRQFDFDAVARIPVLLNGIGKKMVEKNQ